MPEIFLRFCESIFVVWQVENIGKRKKSGQLLSVSFEELREQAERLVSKHFSITMNGKNTKQSEFF